MRKKQNTRRSLQESIYKIYGAGIFVFAGFIVGFDSEKGNTAEGMIECIEDTAIPVCTVGLLYALPATQLGRRLLREGRLFPGYDAPSPQDAGDQCTIGLNFETKRPRRDVLADYRAVLAAVYDPSAYFGRVRRVARMLRCGKTRFRPRSSPGSPPLIGSSFGRTLWPRRARGPPPRSIRPPSETDSSGPCTPPRSSRSS